MALIIENEEAGRLAKEIAERVGITVDEVVLKALKSADSGRAEWAVDRRRRIETEEERQRRHEIVRQIQERLARARVADPRSPDEILGYDENGLPT